jgi:hypothetical protein
MTLALWPSCLTERDDILPYISESALAIHYMPGHFAEPARRSFAGASSFAIFLVVSADGARSLFRHCFILRS